MYPVSMAMLDLLVGGAPPSDSAAANDHLACVVFVMREMFAGFHKWRYRNTRDKDQIGQVISVMSSLHHYVVREMFAGFHKWRYRNARDKDQIGRVI